MFVTWSITSTIIILFQQTVCFLSETGLVDLLSAAQSQDTFRGGYFPKHSSVGTMILHQCIYQPTCEG